MKKFALLILTIAISFAGMAQAPQSFAFQSTITDTLGNPMVSQTVSVQFDIHTGSGSGPIVYSETQSVMTSAAGYISVNIGQGVVVLGTFSTIAWDASSHYLELLLDTGTSYMSLGTSQLLSVPYALHAETSSIADTALYVQNVPAPVMSSYFMGSSSTTYTGVMDTLLFDIDINRNTNYSTNGVYTVQVSGIYEITGGHNAFPSTINYVLNGVTVATGPSYNVTLELLVGDTFFMETDNYDTTAYMKIQEIK